MADESNNQPTQQQPEQAAPTAAAQDKTGGETTFTQADVERIVKERLEREKRKTEEATAKAKADAEVEAARKNGEFEKLATQYKGELERLQGELKSRELLDRKRTIAEKVGLPAALASRLVGETDEDLEKDAKAILDTLPKPTKPSPGIVPANPGANGSTGETDEQKKSRLGLTQKIDIFDRGFMESNGGGSFINDK